MLTKPLIDIKIKGSSQDKIWKTQLFGISRFTAPASCSPQTLKETANLKSYL